LLELENWKDYYDRVFEVWNPITILEFTKLINELGDMPGPIRGFQKSILLLYQITEGCANNAMPLKEASWRRLFEYVYSKKESVEIIEEWAQKWFSNFTNLNLRVLYANLNNPPELKSVTYMCDGKDFESFLTFVQNEFRRNESGVSNLISHKNKKGGIWTQGFKIILLMDIRGFIRGMTTLVGCNEKYDGHLVEDLNILELMDERDCLSADHHFDKFMKETFTTYPYSRKNYVKKYTKPYKKNFSPGNLEFNGILSGLLSKIECEINAGISNKCKIFNGKSRKKWLRFDQIKPMLMICYVLMGIDKQVKRFPEFFEDKIEDDQLYGILNSNFEFPLKRNETDSEEAIEQNNYIKEMKNFNKNFIEDLINNNDKEIEDDGIINQNENFNNQIISNDHNNEEDQDLNDGNENYRNQDEVNENSNEEDEKDDNFNKDKNNNDFDENSDNHNDFDENSDNHNDSDENSDNQNDNIENENSQIMITKKNFKKKKRKKILGFNKFKKKKRKSRRPKKLSPSKFQKL